MTDIPVPLKEYIESRFAALREYADALFAERQRWIMDVLAERQKWITDILAERDVLHRERDQRQQDRFDGVVRQFSSETAEVRKSAEAVAEDVNRRFATTNEWRAMSNETLATRVSRSEWQGAHQLMIDRMDAAEKSLSQRMDRMDNERNMIKDTVTRLDSRAGYVSVSLILSIVAVLLTLGMRFLSH